MVAGHIRFFVFFLELYFNRLLLGSKGLSVGKVVVVFSFFTVPWDKYVVESCGMCGNVWTGMLSWGLIRLRFGR